MSHPPVDIALAPRGERDSASATAVHRLVFDSADLGRTEQFLSASYAPMRIGSTNGRSGAHVTRYATGALSTDRLDLRFEMSYDVEPLDRICLCTIDTGTIEDHRVEGWRESETFGPGAVFSLAPPDRPYAGRVNRARYSITMLDPLLLNEAAGTGRVVRLLDHHPINATAAHQLVAAIAHLRDDVLAVPDVRLNPLVVSAAARYLAASVLSTFPNDAAAESSAADRRDAHPATLRRAIAFIEANAGSDISMAGIAAAAHVSVRAVQLAFRQYLDTTPMAYLRRVRLGHARAALQSAAPGDTTVTRVAARWGYAQPSSFAAHYRAAYGESPSQTLRRG